MADQKAGVPNTPDTLYRIGSVTKQFTALAVLKLQERGKLKVTDKNTKHSMNISDQGDDEDQ